MRKELILPLPRWLAALTVSTVVGSSLIAGAAVAAAGPDDTYLARLRTLGFTWPPDHDAALTAMGRLICDDIAWGWTYDQIAQSIHANLDPRNGRRDVHGEPCPLDVLPQPEVLDGPLLSETIGALGCA